MQVDDLQVAAPPCAEQQFTTPMPLVSTWKRAPAPPAAEVLVRALSGVWVHLVALGFWHARPAPADQKIFAAGTRQHAPVTG